MVPSAYPEPLVPVQLDAASDVMSRVPSPRVAVDGPSLDLFPSYLISTTHCNCDPVTSLIMPVLQEDADFLLSDSMATMDQYLSVDKDLLLGHMADLPLLSLPL